MEYTRSASGEATIRETLDVLRRQWWIILISLLVCLALGVAAILLVDPAYQATTQMVVEGRAQANYNTNINNDPLHGVTLSQQDDVPTQLEVIHGSYVVSNALQDVIAANQNFNGTTIEDVDVKARQLGITNAVEVVVTAPSPALAQSLATAIPDSYRRALRLRTTTELAGAIQKVDEQLAAQRQGLQDAQNALTTYSRANKGAVADLQNGAANSQRIQAEAEWVAARADLEAAEKNLASMIAARKAVPERLPNPTEQKNIQQIEDAKKILNDYQTRRESLLETFSPEAREVKEVDALIAQQEKYIAGLPKMIDNAQTIRNPAVDDYDRRIAEGKASVDGFRARVAERKAFFSEASARVDALASQQEQLARLGNEIQLKQASVTRLSQQLDELTVLQNAVRDPVQVTLPAQDAVKSRPNPPLYLILAAMLGLLMGGAICFAKDRLEDRVNTLDHAYRIAQAPTLGYVPPKQLARAGTPNALPTRVMENYRIVRSNLLFSNRETPFKSLMVTSTGPGEGKSDVAANLAIAMASGGKQVLLVDANFHRPAVHERFGRDRNPGLSDVIDKNATLDEAVFPTTIDRLSILTAGSAAPNVGDGLASDEMQRMYEEMISKYDLVIFDTPAMLPRSDALALSATVDTVVYVVKPGATTKTLMRYCIDLLSHARARLLGVVFTNTEFYEEAAI